MRQLRVVGWTWVALAGVGLLWRLASAAASGQTQPLGAVVGGIIVWLGIGVAGWYLRVGSAWARIAIGACSAAAIGFAVYVTLVLAGMFGSGAQTGAVGWIILGAIGYLVPTYSLVVVVSAGRKTRLASAST